MSATDVVRPGELVESIVRCIEERISAYPHRRTSNTKWTSAVKCALRELGSARGEQVRCTDGTAGPNEFLVDVMWYNPDTHRPDAVFESEWKSIDEILYDFQKLLYLKCPLKVLICDPAPAHRPRLIPGLIELLKRYPDHVAGEQYVVINVKGSSFGGEADCYTWEVPRSAANPADIRFSMIEGSPFTYTLRERPASASVAGG